MSLLRNSAVVLKRSFLKSNSVFPDNFICKHIWKSDFFLTTNKFDSCNIFQTKRFFHKTPQLKLNPLFFRLGSIYIGRKLRKLWKNLPIEQKTKIKSKIKNSHWKILSAVTLMVAACILNYFAHLEEHPITHRKRYIALSKNQIDEVVDNEFASILANVSKDLLRSGHPVYDKVSNIISQIIKSNQDVETLRNKDWKIFIVQSTSKNAVVLPNGSIFLYTGILDIATNNDRLAAVLSHEIAHVVCNHSAEQLSQANFLNLIVIFIIGAIWFIMPNDFLAIVTQWFHNMLMQCMFHLPYSRKLEIEADEIGLQLMAKACFDVRECAHLWQAMSDSQNTDELIPELLSTHPSNETRVDNFNKLIPSAIIKRLECNCIPLQEPCKKMD